MHFKASPPLPRRAACVRVGHAPVHVLVWAHAFTACSGHGVDSNALKVALQGVPTAAQACCARCKHDFTACGSHVLNSNVSRGTEGHTYPPLSGLPRHRLPSLACYLYMLCVLRQLSPVAPSRQRTVGTVLKEALQGRPLGMLCTLCILRLCLVWHLHVPRLQRGI